MKASQCRKPPRMPCCSTRRASLSHQGLRPGRRAGPWWRSSGERLSPGRGRPPQLQPWAPSLRRRRRGRLLSPQPTPSQSHSLPLPPQRAALTVPSLLQPPRLRACRSQETSAILLPRSYYCLLEADLILFSSLLVEICD